MVVEGACVTHAEFRHLLREAFQSDLSDPAIFLEKRRKKDGGSVQSSKREGKLPVEDCSYKDEMEQAQQSSKKLKRYDFCMFLKGDSWTDCMRYANLLLLSWADREAQVAQRVGLARMPVWRHEANLKHFYQRFEAVGWERWTMKLV
jgi:hypothetical protein